MGARGPGAKPTRKTALPAGEKGKRKPRWQWRGLSRAERVIAFVRDLQITSGPFAGQRLKLRPWQRKIVRVLYATDAGGQRIVRTGLVTMPRKNGKTQLVAALALAHLVGPEAEPRGQVYSAAADRDQAGIIFREMEAMILADPTLAERCNIQRFAKRIEDMETGSIYQALSSDARKAHGLNASFVAYDELAQAPNRHLYDTLMTSTGGRAEPLVLVISTCSSDPHHIMSELVDYGRHIQEGVIEDSTFHATIYAAPQNADPWDEAVWRDCNPALGDFRSLKEMRAFAEQAKRIPAKEAAFRALYLNQPVDPEQRFIGSADWVACNAPVEAEALRGRPCWGGLDLSSTKDLTAFVLYFPEDGGAVLPWFWLPGDNLGEREDRDRVPYRIWCDRDLIEANPGRAIDKKAIAGRLAEIAAAYDLRAVAYDRWRIQDLKKALADDGIELPMIPWGQGFHDMGPAVDALEAAVLHGNLRHGGHPVLTWNVSNAIVVSDSTAARKIAKDKSIGRVDGLVALAMALGVHAREPRPIEYDFSRSLVLGV